MTNEQLTEKFVDQASLVLGDDRAKAASDAAWSIVDSDDVATALHNL